MKNTYITGYWQNWKIPSGDSSIIQSIRREFDIPAWVARFLIHRGFSSPGACENFLYPTLAKLPNPDIFPDFDIAVKRVHRALVTKEKIVVYGDYDVDGITGTTILTDFLTNLGASVKPVVPNRFKHGYGLNTGLIDELSKERVKLLITVDCGITNAKEVDHATKLGIDTIVTDHHQPGSVIPRALAVIDPQLLQKDTENTEIHHVEYLAGVGVAFYFLIALRKYLRTIGFWKNGQEPNLKRYLDLVALGTIADQVPLSGVNRIISKYGLMELEKSHRPGIRALLKLCNLEGKKISVWDVGFLLAPRINAAGRMGLEHLALELLLSDDPERAKELASKLDILNQQRQREEEEILREALALIENSPDIWDQASSIVLAKDDWHRGIIGIVASRLVEKFGKPTILLSKNKEFLEGSARSVARFNIFKALNRCSSLLEKFGGHKMAAGLKIAPSSLEEFIEKFNEVAATTVPASGTRKELTIDAKLTLEDISEQTLDFIERLSPYGLGNPRPVFLLESFNTRNRRIMKEKHLSLQIEQNGKSMRAVGFNVVDDPAKLPDFFRFLAFYPVYNHWEGNTYIELRIIDFC